MGKPRILRLEAGKKYGPVLLGAALTVQPVIKRRDPIQLVGMGWPGPAGSVHISTEEGNKVKELQEAVDRRLGLLDMPDSRRYAATGAVLLAENKAFAEKLLAEFDREHAEQLHTEHKMPAGGDGWRGRSNESTRGASIGGGG